MRNLLFLVILSVTFSSCVFIYSARNQNMYYLNLQKTSNEKFHETKQISNYDYTDNNVKYFTENGYVMIGYDAIRHTYIGYQEAVNAGCWIGATVMLYKHQYIGTSSGNALVPFYNQGDTYSVNSKKTGSVNLYGSSSASVYGSGGYAYGNSTSRVYGTSNSSTSTTITTPGSFSYYSVPYSNDYYGVNFYTKADTKSKKLLIIPANSWFELISKSDKKIDGYSFIKIKYKDVIGYVINSYALK
jgi:hypothetical protein